MPIYCQCGCNEEIPSEHLFRFRPPYYLRGHMQSSECACGCGECLPYSPSRRYKNARYIRGHSRRLNLPLQQCACGCGQIVTVHHGRPRKFITGHSAFGIVRGPGFFVQNGYKFIHVGNNRYRGEHRIVMESFLGRPLKKRYEHVHHINGNRLDNRLENLTLLNISVHGKQHGRPKGIPVSKETRHKLSEASKHMWAERKAKH